MTQESFQPSTPEEVESTLLAEMRAVIGDAAPGLIQELAPMFLEDAPRLIAQMATAVATHSAASLKESAHTLKGSSGSMGIKGLAQLSLEMERIGRDEQLEQAPAKLDQLRAEYAVVEQVLNQYLA